MKFFVMIRLNTSLGLHSQMEHGTRQQTELLSLIHDLKILQLEHLKGLSVNTGLKSSPSAGTFLANGVLKRETNQSIITITQLQVDRRGRCV